MKTLTNPKQSTAKSWASDPRFPAVLFLSNHVAKKRCKACGVEKPLSEFHKAKANKDGRHTECNVCRCAARRRYCAENRELVAIQNQRLRRKHRAKRLRASKEYRRTHVAEIKAYYHATYNEKFQANAARGKVRVAKRHGLLIEQPCEICGEIEGIEAHHEDYSKPLNVRWLCRIHHARRHVELNREAVDA